MAVIVNISTFAAAALAAIKMSNRKRLESKNYPEAYIDFQQQFNKKFGIQFFIFIIIVQSVLFAIAAMLSDGPGSRDYIYIILVPALMLALPFALLKTVQMNKEYKRLSEETGYQLAADFGFIKLKKIFNPRLELIASLFIISYILLFALKPESTIIILYVMLLWFFAAAVRFSRYSIKPVLRDQYHTMAKMMLIYQALLLFLLFIPQGILVFEENGTAAKIMFSVISAGLTAKLIYYAVRYPAFIREIKSEQNQAE